MALFSNPFQKSTESDPRSALTLSTRRWLRREAERRIGEAAQRLREGDVEAAGRHLEWAERAGAVLTAPVQPLRKIFLAAIVALCCLIPAGLALWLPTGNIPLLLEVEVDDLTLKLRDDRSWKSDDLDIETRRIRLTNLKDLDAPGLGHNGPVTSLALEIMAAQQKTGLRLKRLRASAGTRLLLHVTDYPRLDIKAGVLEGQIEANNVQMVLKGANGSKNDLIQGPLPETLNFTTRQSSAGPAQLKLESQKPWRLDGLFVQELVFERLKKEEPPDSDHWVSTLLSGKISLLETEKKISLHKDDWLKLGRVEGHRLIIEFNPKKPDRFKLQFHGTVEKVEAGPDGFIRNLAPTWLEYLYHQQSLALFWSAVVFLWGMFWSLRNLLGRG
jgi:hypothetical protein